MRGTSGTDDLLLMDLSALGGLGKKKVIFSSSVMLLVSLGCGRTDTVALLVGRPGKGGRGGSCDGLPGVVVDLRRDVLPTREPLDFVRLWIRSGFRGMGRGRWTTESDVPGVQETGAGAGAGLVEPWPAPLMMASTTAGSLYSMLLTNRIVLCCDPDSSPTWTPRARGLDGRPMVGRLWRGVLVASGGGAFGDGGIILEGRISVFNRGCNTVRGRFGGDSDRDLVDPGACAGDTDRGWAVSSGSDGRGDLRRVSSPPGDSCADVVDATATSPGRSAPGKTLSRVATEETSFRLRLTARFTPSSGDMAIHCLAGRPAASLSS
jgi:hypothetical protein